MILDSTPVEAPCYPGSMPHPQITRVTIEGTDFTLSFDYDQLQNGQLSQLSDDGRIDWFCHRMRFVFLEPLILLYSGRHSSAYRALTSTDPTDLPARSFAVATFSVLLNGIEALGSFLMAPPISKRHNFCAFITSYMPSWDTLISNSPYGPTADLKNVLWKHFRNGIAHGFCIEGGGIDNEADPSRWIVTPTLLHIGPNTFFTDFRAGVDRFFSDIATNPATRATFLARFRQIYPH